MFFHCFQQRTLEVLAVARLTSSISTICAKSGPRWNTNLARPDRK